LQRPQRNGDDARFFVDAARDIVNGDAPSWLCTTRTSPSPVKFLHGVELEGNSRSVGRRYLRAPKEILGDKRQPSECLEDGDLTRMRAVQFDAELRRWTYSHTSPPVQRPKVALIADERLHRIVRARRERTEGGVVK